MFREICQVLLCLSLLVSSSFSLHMIRDAYHRPMNELSHITHDTIVIGSTKTKRTSDNGLNMRATRIPLTNNLKYHELFPSSLSSSSLAAASGSSSSSSSSSSASSTLPRSLYFRGGALRRPSVTDTNDRYRWQKKVCDINSDSFSIAYRHQCDNFEFFGKWNMFKALQIYMN